MYDCSEHDETCWYSEHAKGSYPSFNYLPSIAELAEKLYWRCEREIARVGCVGPIALHSHTQRSYTRNGWWAIGPIDYGRKPFFRAWWDIYLGSQEIFQEMDARLRQACINAGQYSTTEQDAWDYVEELELEDFKREFCRKCGRCEKVA